MRRVTARLVLLAVSLGITAALSAPASLGASAAQQSASPGASAYDSLTLITPRSVDTGVGSVALTAARNEFESFQVKVAARTKTARSVRVSLLRPFTMAGARIPASNVRIYREAYYTPTTMSDSDLSAQFPRDAAGTCVGDCRIPDALIPEVDALVHQNRNAFPVDIPAHENRVAWVDVLVPRSAKPGTYTGTIRVTADGVVVRDMPVTLTVLAARIPSTPSMASQILVSYNDIAARTDGAIDVSATWARYAQLAELGLDNRIGVVIEGGDPRAGAAVLDRLLDGRDPVVRLAGARLTTVPFSYPPAAAAWRQALTSIGHADAARFFCDEVTTADCATSYDHALAGFPGLALQDIPDYLHDPNLPGTIEPRATTIVPLVNGIDGHEGEFATWAASHPGAQLWAYTSCMSAGCTSDYTPDPFWSGWPGYGIDQPTTAARAMGWHGIRLGIAGEHYWAAVHGFAQSWNACAGVKPTNCLYTVGGESGMNGDGLLFYAPNPAVVGGRTPIPIESIRLKRFRDGREDNELLTCAKRAGHSAAVEALVAATYPTFKALPSAASVLSARGTLTGYLRSSVCG
ncbi:MAG: hypothetical protein V9G19_16250 [Tetrasphaera sp.]